MLGLECSSSQRRFTTRQTKATSPVLSPLRLPMKLPMRSRIGLPAPEVAWFSFGRSPRPEVVRGDKKSVDWRRRTSELSEPAKSCIRAGKGVQQRTKGECWKSCRQGEEISVPPPPSTAHTRARRTARQFSAPSSPRRPSPSGRWGRSPPRARSPPTARPRGPARRDLPLPCRS